MTPRSLAWIAQAAGGELHGGDRMVDALATDTRALPQGKSALFVALKGEHFDGHDQVAAAANGGCVAALVARAIDAGIPQVVVRDTKRALAAIAAEAQRARATKVLAITGSNGKTSVKALLVSIMDQLGGAYATPGNRNNEIGLPLAVLDAPEDARFAVYEMGAGKPGDIAYLTAIARPDVALVNNIAPAHLEGMGSLLGVADTKAAIYDALLADGVAVINADDAFAPYFMARAHGRRILRFGLDASADILARDIRADGEGSHFVLVVPQGDVDIALPMPGRHNVCNALAAASMALGVGATLTQVRAGLAAVQPVAGRQVAHRLRSGAVLIDDSYNANPGSVDAAIHTLASACAATEGGEAWLVLGEMRELGADEVALHAQAGARAKSAGIARLYTLGTLSAAAAQAFGNGARHAASHAELIEALRAQVHAGVRVLVKGSRGSAMDQVVKALLAADAAADKGDADAA